MAADPHRIRVAYERGRLTRAASGALPIAVVALVALALSPTPAWTCAFGIALVATAIVLLWRGGAGGRAVMPGVIAGAFPAAAALVAMSVGYVCTGESCASLCVPACFGGALLAGFGLARVVRRGKVELR